MLTEERQSYILDQLNTKNIVKLKEIATTLNASESTIRRDFEQLEEQGYLERVHGGAKRILQLDYEQNMEEKSIKNKQEKVKIAKLAASFVEDGDIIFLDAGSTTVEMIAFLTAKNIQVVTNSVHHAAQLADKKIPTMILGGKIKLSTKVVLGPDATDEMNRYQFNKAFLGMNGVHQSFGYTTPDLEEAHLKKLAIHHAQESFVLADSSKFQQVTFVKVGDLREATILTEKFDEQLGQEIPKLTTVLQVEEEN
ncbi:MAG: DeoR/GlpR family DNA-binding transcription regulator [Lactobacillales bacterium]|nr:DeoR/GlpR family DNA-binding transcription regulator [Lactobacillales bacterium]